MDPVKQLNRIIEASLKENSLDKLNEYLESLENSKKYLNGKLISVLVQILKKKGKHEEKTLHVDCVLNCLQHLVNKVRDPQKWEKVSEDLGKLCELVFVISSSYIQDENVVQRVVNVIFALASTVDTISDNLLKFLLKTLLAASLCLTHTKCTRSNIMILIGSLLQKTSRAIRSEIIPPTINHLNDLSNYLNECDDYETQVSVVEILARSLIFINQKHYTSLFTNNREIGEIFKKYQPFLNFDPDCRLFLNEVNNSLGNHQKVFSVPCMVVSTDQSRLKKPNDPAYSDFWVDFNLGSKSVSFYYQPSHSESWELMTIPQDKVIKAVAKDSACQSRTGEKFDAVKLELSIESTDLTSSQALPQMVKIYPQKDKFKTIEPVIQNIFNEKYEALINYTEVKKETEVDKETLGKKSAGNTHKTSDAHEEKSYCDTSALSKCLDDEGEEDEKEPDKSSQSSLESEEADKEESNSSYFRYIRNVTVKEGKNEIVTKSSQANEGNEFIRNESEKIIPSGDNNYHNYENPLLKKVTTSDLPQIEDFGFRNNISNQCFEPSNKNKRSSKKSMDTGLKDDNKAKLKNVQDAEIKKSENLNIKKNTSELSTSSKKKRLYSFETSNPEEVMMSSQDQDISVEIPAYKITKRKTYVKPKPIVNRRNISYSYITSKEKENSVIDTKTYQQKQSNFEVPSQTQKSLSDDESTDEVPSSPKIFKDTLPEPEKSAQLGLNRKFFGKNLKNNIDVGQTTVVPQEKFSDRLKSAYSDFSSPERRENLKCKNTYGRGKLKKAWKRNRIMQIESSGSDSQYLPPAKLFKEDAEEHNDLSPRKTRFADKVLIDKIDPLRDNIFTNEMELEVAKDFEEPTLQTRELVTKSLIHGKQEGNISVKVVSNKRKNAVKRNTTKPTSKKGNSVSKKHDAKRKKKDYLEKLTEESEDCMDVVHYESPVCDSPLGCDDMELEMPSRSDDQNVHLHPSLKMNDMVRFGKLLIKQIQEKLLTSKRLSQKEREMNFAKFDYKIQASSTVLYGNCQKMESVTDKLEKLNDMLQATYKLHKEIAAQISAEALKIEEAKNDLMKSINKVEKTESSKISAIFQGFGGYLKKFVISFSQGNSKSAITN